MDEQDEMFEARILDEAIQAFDDAMEEERKTNGWPKHDKPPFDKWPENEKESARRVFRVFINKYLHGE